jgi:hypothetical protein
VSTHFLLYGKMLFVLLFNTFKFMSCHGSDTTCIVIIGWKASIPVLGVLPTWFHLAATSTDKLELTFLFL